MFKKILYSVLVTTLSFQTVQGAETINLSGQSANSGKAGSLSASDRANKYRNEIEGFRLKQEFKLKKADLLLVLAKIEIIHSYIEGTMLSKYREFWNNRTWLGTAFAMLPFTFMSVSLGEATTKSGEVQLITDKHGGGWTVRSDYYVAGKSGAVYTVRQRPHVGGPAGAGAVSAVLTIFTLAYIEQFFHFSIDDLAGFRAQIYKASPEELEKHLIELDSSRTSLEEDMLGIKSQLNAIGIKFDE